MIELIKSSFAGLMVILIKTASLFAINKILAIKLGPEGYAGLGNIQNLMSIFIALSGSAMTTGVTKLSAGNSSFKDTLRVRNVAFTISLILSFLIALILFLFSQEISIKYFDSNKFSDLIKIIAICTPFIVLNNILISLLNGIGYIKIYTIINITYSLISPIIFYLILISGGELYALYGLVIYQVSGLLITSFLLYFYKVGLLKKIKLEVENKILLQLLSYWSIAIISSLTIPYTYMSIRQIIQDNFGENFAGILQASWRISDTYLTIIITALTFYLLPKLVKHESIHDIKKELLKVLSIFIPITLLCALFINFFKYDVINILYSSEFYSISELLFWQLSGDVLKVFGWILSFYLIAKCKLKIYILLEIIYYFEFYILSKLLIKKYGFIGTSLAYFYNQLSYVIIMIIILNYYLKFLKKNNK